MIVSCVLGRKCLTRIYILSLRGDASPLSCILSDGEESKDLVTFEQRDIVLS